MSQIQTHLSFRLRKLFQLLCHVSFSYLIGVLVSLPIRAPDESRLSGKTRQPFKDANFRDRGYIELGGENRTKSCAESGGEVMREWMCCERKSSRESMLRTYWSARSGME